MGKTVEPPVGNHPKCLVHESLDHIESKFCLYMYLAHGNYKIFKFVSFKKDTVQCMCIFSLHF